MRERLSKETLRLLQEIEESVKDVLEQAEKELKSMTKQQRLELFGTTEVPFFDDPKWTELFPLGSEEEDLEEEF